MKTNPRLHPLFDYGLLAALLITAAAFLFPVAAQAQDFVWAPDFPVGSRVPPITAVDQNGTPRSFANLTGEKGLLFMLSRSFDW